MARDPAVFSLPSYVACPRCHGSLVPSEGGVMCAGCLSHYPRHSTVHFAAAADDPEKAHQQAIYDGQAPDTMLELPYRDVDEYRDYCSRITGIVRLLGIDGRHFKALKTRQVLDRLRPQPGEHVLDIGSGAGSTLALLTLHYGAKGTGV